MNMHLMIGNLITTNDGIEGRVIELYTNTIVIEDKNGEHYWVLPSTAKPILLTDKGINEHDVLSIAWKNTIELDFSCTHRLKVTLFNPDGSIQITYYYPKPMYVHELQQILGYFNIDLISL